MCGPSSGSFPIPLVSSNKQATIRYKPTFVPLVLHSSAAEQARSLSINHFPVVILCRNRDAAPSSSLRPQLHRIERRRMQAQHRESASRGVAMRKSADDTLFDLWRLMPLSFPYLP